MLKQFLSAGMITLTLVLVLIAEGCTVAQHTYHLPGEINQYINAPVISVRLKDGEELYFNERRGRCIKEFRGIETMVTITGQDIDNKPLTIDLREVTELQFQTEGWNYPVIALITLGTIVVTYAIPLLIFLVGFSHAHLN